MEKGCAAKRMLATEGTPPCGKGSLDLALYNPCFSGMTILCTVYKENLNTGHSCLNLVSQHLCIYFKKEEGVLRTLLYSKQLGRNQFGQFSKGHHEAISLNISGYTVAVGMRLNVATRLASKTGLSFLAQDRMMLKKKSYSDFRKRISSGSIENEVPIVNSSGSYRCLILSDFFPEPTANGSSDWLCQFRERVSESLASIDEDQELLSFNTFCVAADQFDFVHDIKRQKCRF
jgi:hypothetical protein